MNIQEIDGIKCLYTNAECITNKWKELEIVVELHKPKIIGVVEPWCHREILDSELTFRFGINFSELTRKEARGLEEVLCFTFIDR